MALDTDWLSGFVYNPESVKKLVYLYKGIKTLLNV